MKGALTRFRVMAYVVGVFLLLLCKPGLENDRNCDQSKTQIAQIELHTVLSAFKATANSGSDCPYLKREDPMEGRLRN